MPTTRRRHTITETPDVEAALDALRDELGDDAVCLPELVILGAQAMLAQRRLEAERMLDERAALAQMIRSRAMPGDVAAGLEAHESGWSHSPA